MKQVIQNKKTRLLLDNVKSFCPKCYKLLNSEIIKEGVNVFMIKECCGEKIKVLKEKDISFYEKVKKYSIKNTIEGLFKWEELPKKIDHISAITFHITERCNTNCAVCVNDNGKITEIEKYLTLERLKEMLNDIKNKKKVILISGGEPTVREDLPEIIKAICESGNIPYIATNGIKLADYEFAKKLKNAGLKMIMFSLDSLDGDKNAKLRGGHGILIKKLKALENIKKCSMKVYLSMTVIDKFNLNEIGKIIRFAARNNEFISGIIMRPLLPCGRLNISKEKDVTLSDLIESAEKQTGGIINKNYMLEFRRFKFNIYNLIQRLFGKDYTVNMAFNYFLDCMLKIKKNKDKLIIKQMIDYEKLKNMNELIEDSINKSKMNLIFNLPKLVNFELFKFILTAITSKFDFSKILSSSFNFKNMIRITIGDLPNTLNADLSEKYSYYSVIFFEGDSPQVICGYVAGL
jgi:uncharacterized radical SAM superfamily Fe-S cluster-containing enzyme